MIQSNLKPRCIHVVRRISSHAPARPRQARREPRHQFERTHLTTDLIAKSQSYSCQPMQYPSIAAPGPPVTSWPTRRANRLLALRHVSHLVAVQVFVLLRHACINPTSGAGSHRSCRPTLHALCCVLHQPSTLRQSSAPMCPVQTDSLDRFCRPCNPAGLSHPRAALQGACLGLTRARLAPLLLLHQLANEVAQPGRSGPAHHTGPIRAHAPQEPGPPPTPKATAPGLGHHDGRRALSDHGEALTHPPEAEHLAEG